MAAFAILGAALGLFVRPRALGVALPVMLAAIVQGGVFWMVGVMAQQPNRELLIDRLQGIFGEGWIGAAGPVAAALIGASMAALMSAFTDPKKVSLLTADGLQRRVGKDGRYARAQGMVEDRAIHAKAESRIDQILGL
ncbi:hypothetical protein [Caulobacter sp. 1776]|uniref:hypothetical protein n=1 Tax=Caulobacter sp. 1776 TaxID=3156420 RepID=UPI003390EB43